MINFTGAIRIFVKAFFHINISYIAQNIYKLNNSNGTDPVF